jgi:hypothetical protein
MASRLGEEAHKGIAMLLRKVEKFLKTHDMAATKFGRLAANDPRFVLDLRMGRIPRPDTEARTLEWMAEFEASLETSPALAHASHFNTDGAKGLVHAA